MRLQLTRALLIAGGALAAPVARAEPAPDVATATLRVYADDDHVTVVSPAARVSTTAGPLGLDLDLTIDAITAASVDVVTSASPATVTERRVEAETGVRLALGRLVTARAGAAVSHEADYDALRAGLGVTLELAARNTTLELRARAGHDHATDVTDPMFAASRASLGLIATLTQVVDRRTLGDLTVEVDDADGWHGSPYRRVLVAATTPGPLPAWVREATPARRTSLAAAVRVRRALAERWFGAATARAYADDWDVRSATATVELRRARDTGTLVGLTARGYGQSAARFWARRYDATPLPTWRTADRSLGPMASMGLEAVVDHPLGQALGQPLEPDGPRLLLAVGVLGLFFDSPAQARRVGITATLALSVPL